MTRIAARVLCSVLAVFVLLCPSAYAADILTSQIQHQNGAYTMRVAARLQVSRAAAFAALLDYQRLPELHPSIVSVKRSLGEGGEPRLAIDTRVCISVFCRNVRQVQSMFPQPPNTLRAVIDPALSDFHEGLLSWRVEPETAVQSTLIFSAKVKPKFWVPPVIGPWMIKRKLTSEALESAHGVEKVAALQGTEKASSDASGLLNTQKPIALLH